MADVFAHLEAEYCPPLDPALLSAIVSDYDLASEAGVADARTILDQLKESAQLEEAADFDPSGTAVQDDGSRDKDQPESLQDASASLSQDTELTSLSNGLSSLGLSGDHESREAYQPNREDLARVEELDDEAKIQVLQEVFGEQVNLYSIKYTLKKCNGRWDATVEELLNQVYFGEAGNESGHPNLSTKSIDAFSEDSMAKRGRKGKAVKKRMRNLEEKRASSLPSSSLDASATRTNKWKSASEDIDFISTRMGLSATAVSSTYYETGASLPRTIGALLKASMDDTKRVATDDMVVAANARELGRDFPTIASEYLVALIRVTHPSTAAAHELAKALMKKPSAGSEVGIQIIPRYASASDLDDDSDSDLPGKRTLERHGMDGATDPSIAAARRDVYALAQARAFSQASAAHRRAKSDRLMGGAAAYYGQLGREYVALSSQASAIAANELANVQSDSQQLDLHGIDVRNAVRIALEKVNQWWSNLGEKRVNGRIGAQDRALGYRIVVGLGRHSEGGKGRLGPAVSKALREGGWKVEAAGAVLVVTGPMKK